MLPKIDRQSFPNVLRRCRHTYIGTRSEFATKSGYAEDCIKAWESGQRRPSPKHFEEILSTFQKDGALPHDLRELLVSWLTLHDLLRFNVSTQDGPDFAAADIPLAGPSTSLIRVITYA